MFPLLNALWDAIVVGRWNLPVYGLSCAVLVSDPPLREN
jgi:hypothetical protein